MVPRVDWKRVGTSRDAYEPPRWIGYWKARETCWASDGVLKLAVRDADALEELFGELRLRHYSSSTASLPVVGSALRDPTHLLLHDTEHSLLFIEGFEQAEALLIKQSR